MKRPTLFQLADFARSCVARKIDHKRHFTCLSFLCECEHQEYFVVFKLLQYYAPSLSKSMLHFSLHDFINRIDDNEPAQ